LQNLHTPSGSASPARSRRSPASLRWRLAAGRKRTDELFAIVHEDALYERPIAERHRLAFYLGHVEAFDWNLLREPLLATRSFAPDFDRLFAFGIDPVGTALPSDAPADWPRLGDIARYNGRVRARIDAGLEQLAVADGDAGASQLLNMAIEHRLMHAETLAYLLHRLPYERKRAQAQPEARKNQPAEDSMVEIPAGSTTLGRKPEDGFGWDNEHDAHVVEVPAFAIDRFMTTNAQFLRFVDDDGYQNRAHWTDTDWDWKQASAVEHPAFWRRANGGWRWHGMFTEYELPLDWPVYVSHAEARAYAAWAGKALPTEAEWQRAATGLADVPSGGNVDFRRFDPLPVHADGHERSAFGVVGLRGNGWEWTSTTFGPLPGFRASPHYRGYSADFFDGRHYVLKGGSPRTAACIARPSFRNWFQPHYPYAYAGLRCVIR
jgi:ergothioneine biosynthesis protein EgtB